MRRSKLESKYLKSKSLTDRKKYNIQRNFCKKLSRTTKKEYINNLNTKNVTDNRILKNSKSDKIILKEDGKTVSDEKVMQNSQHLFLKHSCF